MIEFKTEPTGIVTAQSMLAMVEADAEFREPYCEPVKSPGRCCANCTAKLDVYPAYFGYITGEKYAVIFGLCSGCIQSDSPDAQPEADVIEQVADTLATIWCGRYWYWVYGEWKSFTAEEQSLIAQPQKW